MLGEEERLFSQLSTVFLIVIPLDFISLRTPFLRNAR